jgi:hypothetical protein
MSLLLLIPEGLIQSRFLFGICNVQYVIREVINVPFLIHELEYDVDLPRTNTEPTISVPLQ